MKRKIAMLVVAAMVAGLTTTGCSQNGNSQTQTEENVAENVENVDATTGLDLVDMSKWNYNEEHDVYWQTGIPYAQTPANADYENMGFFIPGGYFSAEDNGDGTYTCTEKDDVTVGNYTAETAPIIVPVFTPGYAAMEAPTDYNSYFGYGSISAYTDAGFVLAIPGARGRDEGAPSGVVDFKAAIRYTRYNEDVIPGNMDAVFTEGMSGGGAQSALLGASGDSELYQPYLDEIGAVKGVSDAVMGSMCWCPVTNLDVADEAYEWNLGMTRTTLSDEEKAYSDEMAEWFAGYMNDLGLKDADGQVLQLEKSEEGIYQAGSYYDYLLHITEESLEHFLADTEFPYDSSDKGGVDAQVVMDILSEDEPDYDKLAELLGVDSVDPEQLKDFMAQNGGGEDASEEGSYEEQDDISRANVETPAVALEGMYETAEDYIVALNEPYEWVNYDAASGKVEITSMADFCKAMKVASKGIAAFDQLDRGQGENTLFGIGNGENLHFDAILADIVKGSEYEADFEHDLEQTDALDKDVAYRMDMYNPMYYLSDYYDGYQTSDVAKYWRVRSGIFQGDTALSTEVNLSLAAENYDPGNKVDFETVWGIGHVEAERSGDHIANFIAWVNDCMEN